VSGPWGLWTGDDVADEGESAEPGLPSAEPVDESPELGQPARRGQPEEDTVGVGRLERDQVAALESQLRGALADLENMRKRFDREIARQLAEERARVIAEWVPVVDNLERALEYATANPEAVVEGLQAVRDQAVATLARLGYPRYDDVGHPFNPERDEAVGTTLADAPAGTVVVAVRPGYGTTDKILRPAAVVVSRGAG
jgi:molecular chaperone GrpE